MKKVTVKVLSVVSKRDKFRRAGREFTGEATHIPISELTEDEIATLKNESALVCFETEIEQEQDDEAGDSKPSVEQSKKAK